ncbi:uncharacterized mitochondrial protein AtMg00810-like [Nicotiana tomentosiformis]|uniref:uncharacterized mitochondrial protein AtMg00810-like n=1 Tax=Nicotiana tomentosiformis TaxID=4098 RepID=UPI00388CA424
MVDATLTDHSSQPNNQDSRISESSTAVYVDDIVITGNNNDMLNALTVLANRFSLKDLGHLNYFLGVEVIPHKDGLILSQSKYICVLLRKWDMFDCKGVQTPLSTSVTLSLNDGTPLQMPPNIVSPSTTHWKAVKRVLRYLKHTMLNGLLLRRSFTPELHVYSNADWAGDIHDRTSTSGYVLYLGGNPISWSSKKQHTVARSST